MHRPLNTENGGSNLPNEVIERNLRSNPDGFGIAWRDPKKGLRSKKWAPEDWREFRDFLKKIDKRTNIEYIAHFRTATHGPACYDLSHPFTYENESDGKVLVFHNGVIDIPTQKKESDTKAFVDRVLAKMPSGWWNVDYLHYLVQEAIGWSRLAIMTKDQTIRVNEPDWKVMNGIWYSTNPLPTPTVYGSGRPATIYEQFGYKSHDDDDHDVIMGGGSWRKDTSGILTAQFSDVDDDDEEDPDVIYASAAMSGIWEHMGHSIYPISGDMSQEGEVMCDSCKTTGYFYVPGPGPKVFIDLAHVIGVAAN